MRKLMIAALKEVARAAASALIAALGLAASVSASGCTTINIPADDARPASFNGVTTFRVDK